MNNLFKSKTPTTLAIDTSFDETAVSVVKGFNILSNLIPSSAIKHKEFGGVVPYLAKFEHEKIIDSVIEKSLKASKLNWKDIDAVAVTKGPGLSITLEVGIRKAKELAEKYNKPLIAVNHMEGHLLSCLAKNSKDKIQNKINFPVLGFLVSGGHTELVLVKDFGDYKKIGWTLDDACGEAYDKFGRLIGLGYPAGSTITEFAKQNRKNIDYTIRRNNNTLLVKVTNKNSKAEYELPISMVYSGDLNMSYSGLKTAARNLLQKITGQKDDSDIYKLDKQQILDLCSVFELAAIKQLEIKLENAIKEYNPTEVWIGGGVVNSVFMRSSFRKMLKNYNIKLKYPYSKNLTTDNAAMIGIAANLKFAKYIEKGSHKDIFTKDFEKIDRDPNWEIDAL